MADNLLIFDTTLRDGEQSPGCSMNLEEKLRMASMLDQMGVDIIEAGFPIASKGDFHAVQEIAKIVRSAAVCGLARAKQADIEAAGEAISAAEKKRIHTFISTSPLHMKYKLQMSPETVLEAITQSIKWAGEYTDDIEWSAEDGSRTEIDFLCKSVETAIAAGATTINIPDTVGYALPEDYAELFKQVINRVPNIDKAVLSVHCHNDLGLAAANSIAGVRAGARQVECTINGIGERAGNAALEEIVMAMKTRHDMLPFTTNIDSTMIMRASKTLSSITGFHVQPNKAIVGANAFSHESGIHQDGMLKNAQTYEIMTPQSVGLQESELVLGKHSGRNAFRTKLKELGYELTDERINHLFVKFKALADKKKTIFEDDLIALVDYDAVGENQFIVFESLSIRAGSLEPQFAELSLSVDGTIKKARSEGNGPVDALFNAIRNIYPHDDTLLALYQVHAVTKGTDAQAEVTVKLEDEKGAVLGSSADVDTLVASCKAYIQALNKLILRRSRTMPLDYSAG